MESAQLSPFMNNWSNVHNFTKESGSFTIKQSSEQQKRSNVNASLNNKFKNFLLTAPHELSLIEDESYFFHYTQLEKNPTLNEVFLSIIHTPSK